MARLSMLNAQGSWTDDPKLHVNLLAGGDNRTLRQRPLTLPGELEGSLHPSQNSVPT